MTNEGDFRLKRGLGQLLRKVRPGRLFEIVRAFFIFRQPFLVALLYLGLTPLPGPATLRLRTGVDIHITNIHDLLSVWGVWVRRDYPVTGKEQLIIDAGANIGAFSLYAAARNPSARIIALEPVNETYQQLTDNIRRNSPGWKRIQPIKLGVAGKDGQEAIFLSDVGTYSSFYRQEHPTSGREMVPTVGLVGLLKEIGNPAAVDILKMDCEGAEMAAILSADRPTLRRFRTIIIEFHEFSGHRIGDLTSHLQAAGFRNARLTRESHETGLAWYTQNPKP